MKLSNFPALRPPSEHLERYVELKVNLFKFTGCLNTLHEYHVKFAPEVHVEKKFGMFLKAAEENEILRNIVFDGVCFAVSKEKIPNQSIKMGGEDASRIDMLYRKSYDLREVFDPVRNVNDHIRCVDTVVRFNQKVNYLCNMRRVFEQERDRVFGAALDIRSGLFNCIRITSEGIFVNGDIAFSVFHRPMSLLDSVVELYIEKERSKRKINLQKADLGESFYNDLEKFLWKVKVRTTHRGPNKRELTFKVSGIYQQAASDVEFEANGLKMNVAEYFAYTYKPLEYPNLPVIVLKRGDGNLYFPMEVLEILPNQKYIKELNEQQASEISKYSKITPIDRFKALREKIDKFNILDNGYNNVFGMAFDKDFAGCKGRILDPPMVRFGGSDVKPFKGSWNLKGVKAMSPVTIGSWMFIAFKGRPESFELGIDYLMRSGSRYGIGFTERPRVFKVRSTEEFVKLDKSSFCLVVLPDENSVRYAKIKRCCEIYGGVITQCILYKNVKLLTNPTFIGNLLLKINSKLGGVNSGLKVNSLILKQATLVLAIDISHPNLGEPRNPSIAAIVGSVDMGMTQYKTVIKQQPKGQEIVSGLKDVVLELLKSFYSKNSIKPEQVVVFRDGVGESMFHEIFQAEIMAIKDGCSSMEINYSPKITFIVAQKRHSIRFLNLASAKEAGCCGNTLPGTIVEDIGHPVFFDFFLVSHYALEGTARPVRYLVLLNESNFGKDIIYNFVYGLCHVYARATKAVSIVPPIYYAHLAAARGKLYLEKDDESKDLVMKKPNEGLSDKLFYL